MKAIFYLIAFLISFLIVSSVSGQTHEIRGKVTEAKSGDVMVGVHIAIKNEVYGTITGNDGMFVLKTNIKLPLVLQISFVGFVTVEVEVTNANAVLDIKMEEQMLLGQEVVISASRIEENILRSPVSIEKMNL